MRYRRAKIKEAKLKANISIRETLKSEEKNETSEDMDFRELYELIRRADDLCSIEKATSEHRLRFFGELLKSFLDAQKKGYLQRDMDFLHNIIKLDKLLLDAISLIKTSESKTHQKNAKWLEKRESLEIEVADYTKTLEIYPIKPQT